MAMIAIITATLMLTTAFGADACGSTATAITPFNLTEYLGVWHQIVVNKQFEELFERNYPLCVYANYSLFANGTVSVVNSGYNSNGKVDHAYGIATQPTPNVGAFQVSFSGSPPGPYNIIKMINDANGQYSIAMVWSCAALGFVEDLWILARDYTISEANYAAMIDYATSSGIDVDKLGLLNTTQTNCQIGSSSFTN